MKNNLTINVDSAQKWFALIITMGGVFIGAVTWASSIQYNITALNSRIISIEHDRKDEVTEWRNWKLEVVEQLAELKEQRKSDSSKIDRILDIIEKQ